MQVPLIVRQPGKIPAGRRQAMMINQFDVFPTVLDYVGLGELSIDNSPGESFAPALLGEEMDWQDEVFFEYITTRVIQTPQWKYTKRFLDSPNELYDMAADPEETRNLIDNADFAPLVAQLDARLSKFFADYADPEFDPWNGGTGKALLFYARRRTDRFREVFPEFRDPFIELRPAFRDSPQ
jgi:arylsulfatase A-like enzyme